jgi:hypothetical protein
MALNMVHLAQVAICSVYLRSIWITFSQLDIAYPNLLTFECATTLQPYKLPNGQTCSIWVSYCFVVQALEIHNEMQRS